MRYARMSSASRPALRRRASGGGSGAVDALLCAGCAWCSRGMLNALIVGGTGLISTGIAKHLLARGAKVAMYNRGRRETVLPAGVRRIVGDRADRGAFVQA